MTTQHADEKRIYRPHSRYLLMALVSAVLFLLLGWNLIAPLLGSGQPTKISLDAGLLFFMAVSLGISLWQVRLALCRVEMTADSITLKAPLARPSTIALKQLTGVSVSGRGGHAITLLYHPVDANRLIDPDAIASLTLPELAEQDDLLAALEEFVPT